VQNFHEPGGMCNAMSGTWWNVQFPQKIHVGPRRDEKDKNAVYRMGYSKTKLKNIMISSFSIFFPMATHGHFNYITNMRFQKFTNTLLGWSDSCRSAHWLPTRQAMWSHPCTCPCLLCWLPETHIWSVNIQATSTFRSF
jgi:hypothetical protein